MTGIYGILNMGEILASNTYPGRGIVIGKSEDGKSAAFAYFIMGRSENSRNRVFVKDGQDVLIRPHDASKVSDPSLIIYSPLRRYKNFYILTNGDQTDTIYEGLSKGKTFEESLRSRDFEPDYPNFTPRISGILDLSDKNFSYKMSIIKSGDALGSVCNRFVYEYTPVSGLGHFLHTYRRDENPLPTFTGEPKRVAVPNTAKELFREILTNLDAENKISLLVRYVSLEGGEEYTEIYNKNDEKGMSK